MPASPDPPPRPDPRDEEERQHRDEMVLKLGPIHDDALKHIDRAADNKLAAACPAPTRALWDAVRTRLDDEHTATPVHQLWHDIARELVDTADHLARGSSRRPPPQPEAIAETVRAVQDAADQLIRPGLDNLGLDLPPRTAAPADEQPAPPPADTPAVQDLERPPAADSPYAAPKSIVRGEAEPEAGGASVQDLKTPRTRTRGRR